MKNFTIAFTAVMAIALLLTWISVAYAEDYVIEMSTENGFEPHGLLTIQQGDSITFTIVNMEEHHDIANPWLGGHNHLAEEQPSITHTFNDCGSYTFDSTWFILDEVVLVDVVDCIIIETTFTSETSIPDVEDVEVFDIPQIDVTTSTKYDGQTGEPLDETETIEVVSTQTPADNETLNLRLEILKVLENILAILFGR